MTIAPHADTKAAPVPTQSTYQNRVADYWNAEENPVNLELGKIDDLYHHHYGVGDVDWTVLDEPDPDLRRGRITTELHRLEHAQAELLAGHLGPARGAQLARLHGRSGGGRQGSDHPDQRQRRQLVDAACEQHHSDAARPVCRR